MTESEAARILADRLGLTSIGTVRFTPELIETDNGQLVVVTAKIPSDLSETIRQLLIMDADGQINQAITLADFAPVRHEDGRWAFNPEPHLYVPPASESEA